MPVRTDRFALVCLENVIVPETLAALQSVRVIDLTTVMLESVLPQILGEMGADVIKIEPPGGDTAVDRCL